MILIQYLNMINGVEITIFLLIFITVTILSRIMYLILTIRLKKYPIQKRTLPIKTVICIGSGGHTSEMIKLIEKINPDKYNPRYYIMAKTDTVSEDKINRLEKDTYRSVPKYNIIKIPRSRVVNQSYVTSVFTTLNSILYCIPIVFKIKPDLILCNGPGTCIPICVIAFLMRVFFLSNTKIIFVESICRVESLSLTGSILNYFADNIVVQWEELKNVCSRADYLGQLF